METIEVEKGVFYRFESYDSEQTNETIEASTIEELIEKVAKALTGDEHFYVYSYHLYEIPYFLVDDENVFGVVKYIPADENHFATIDHNWQCFDFYDHPEKYPHRFLSKVILSEKYKAFKKQEAEKEAKKEKYRKEEELTRKKAEIARLEQELNEAKKNQG